MRTNGSKENNLKLWIKIEQDMGKEHMKAGKKLGIYKKKILAIAAGLCLGIVMCSGCSSDASNDSDIVTHKDQGEIKTKQPAKNKSEEQNNTQGKEQFIEDDQTFVVTDEYVYTKTKLNVREKCSTSANIIKVLPERAKVHRIGSGEVWSKIELEEGNYYVATEYLTSEEPKLRGRLVAIDAGHQEQENKELEPIGPGAKKEKAKATTGTVGISTGLKEYELNLQVAMRLKEELYDRGYEVFMVRESNDVNMSSKERTKMVEESGAEILIRLHANGSDIENTSGALTICNTKKNPYVGNKYTENHLLSETILEHFLAATGANNKGIWETDTMSGINWSSIPVTILEMGYMSNEEEDKKMATKEYQEKMAEGIANGVDAYFEAK